MAVRCARKASATVALHPEGVDRNSVEQVRPLTLSDLSPSTRRAWIEINRANYKWGVHESPSTRRAWIEILLYRFLRFLSQSPSTRRAWIEILFSIKKDTTFDTVALHPEGVDRNTNHLPPQQKKKPVALHPEGVDSQ